MDHTHEVVKNYQTRKAIGAFACFDLANENGEIAPAVLVPLTQEAKHVAHAAQCLAWRPNFKPNALRGSASGGWSSPMFHLSGDVQVS